MGKNQRWRKEIRLEARLIARQAARDKARERFWQQAWPVMNLVLAVTATVVLFLGGRLAIGRLPDSKPVENKSSQEAVIATDKGNIRIAFYANDAPRSVENFILLVQRRYYDGTKFHRVEPGFVIQGGDPLSRDDNPNNDGQGGESAWGGKFADELNSQTDSYKKGYVKGTVAMANSGKNTNGSQFFIVLADQPDLPKDYTIFGYVKDGMSVVEKIVKDDVMQQVTIEKVDPSEGNNG